MMHENVRGMRPRQIDPTLLLAFLLPVFAWAPLTYPGYFVFRSGFLPIFNLTHRIAHLGDWSWVPIVGRSHDLLSGEGSLPYLLAALPAALGAAPPDAIKLVFALAFILGGVGAYSWAKERFGDGWPALVSAALYVLSPIWLPLMYSRGAFAESVLLALLPWVLRAADATAKGSRSALVLLALLSAAGLWTQTALGLVFLFMVLVYVLVLHTAGRATRAQMGLVVAGLVAGALLGLLALLPIVALNGVGAFRAPESWQWAVLLSPWLALFAGWIAGHLGSMLPQQDDMARPALFAALIALALLGAYNGAQPVASAGPIPLAPLAIFGENEIALLNVQTIGTPGPGGRVALEVEWQALRPLAEDYTVFVHILDEKEQRYGQVDTVPQDGKLPTTQWQSGLVIRDRYEAVVAPNAPIESDYRYWLGWYQADSGMRVSARQGVSQARDDKYVVKP